MITKICTECGETKPIREFYRRGGGKTGFRSKCIQCIKNYYHDNADRIHSRQVRRLYDISLKEYDELLDEQGGGCAICGKTPEENGARLSVDHSHKTGEVRGLLCYACNIGLGSFRDDSKLLANAKLYLESF